MVVFIMEANGVVRKILWSYEQASGFMERQFLGNYSTKMFKQQTRLILETFQMLFMQYYSSIIG